MACIWRTYYCKVALWAFFCFFRSHSLPYWSLLLGTNIPNHITIVTSYRYSNIIWLQEDEPVQMQPSPDTGSVDYINFDSPLELLQTLLQQLGGAATVNKLCKVTYLLTQCHKLWCLLISHYRSRQGWHGIKDSRSNMDLLIRYGYRIIL